MAIVFDAATPASGTGTSLTWSHTCSGSDRILLVACYASDRSFTATYNGVAMTELYDGTPGAPGYRFIAVYAMVNPPAGAYDIVVTPSTADDIIAASVSYTGVDQTTAYDTIDVVTGGSDTTVTNDVTSETGDLVVDFVAALSSNTQTAGGSQTERVDNTTGINQWIGISEEAGAATVTMSWALTESQFWTTTGLNLNASAAGTTAALTGTITSATVEADIVTGGKTIILTLTNDTWAAAGTGPIGSTADTQAIIDGITSAQSETLGWNNEVRDNEVTTAVVRTSDTVCTITLTPAVSYDITAQETITATIPAAVLVTSVSSVVASPTFVVAATLPTIATIDSPVLDAEQDNVITTINYSGDITSLIIDDVATSNYNLDVSTSLAGTAGSFTFDMPDVAAYTIDTLGTPFDSASHTHIATAVYAAESDTEVIIINPKTGWVVIEVVSAITTEGSVFFGWMGTPSDGDQVYFPSANNTAVSSTGLLTTDQLTGSINMVFFDQLTQEWKPFDVILTEGGGLIIVMKSLNQFNGGLL